MRRQYGRGPADQITPDEHANLLEQVSHGASAAHLADFAEKVLLKDQESRIRNGIFETIDSPVALDPMKAAQAWIELRAVYKLISKLRKAGQAGQTAHATLESLHPKN